MPSPPVGAEQDTSSGGGWAWLSSLGNGVGNFIDGYSQQANDWIHDTFFNVSFGGSTYEQIKAQNQAANETLGEPLRPDRGVYNDAKDLAVALGGPASMIVLAETATNTDNSVMTRLFAGAGFALGAVAPLGAVSSIEASMCRLVCFTEGTQVVVGTEIINQVSGTEIVEMQSFEWHNVAFAGLCFGLAGMSVAVNRNLKKDKEKRMHVLKPRITHWQQSHCQRNQQQLHKHRRDPQRVHFSVQYWRSFFFLLLLFAAIWHCRRRKVLQFRDQLLKRKPV
jgi:hypothetical protein